MLFSEHITGRKRRVRGGAMSSFKDFIESTKKNELSRQSISQDLVVGISRALASPVFFPAFHMPKSDRDKFACEVVKVANSDEVLTELSRSIEEPKEDESEDEFVERSKAVLSRILRRNFMK